MYIILLNIHWNIYSNQYKNPKRAKMCLLQNIHSHPAFFLWVVEVIPLRGWWSAWRLGHASPSRRQAHIFVGAAHAGDGRQGFRVFFVLADGGRRERPRSGLPPKFWKSQSKTRNKKSVRHGAFFWYLLSIQDSLCLVISADISWVRWAGNWASTSSTVMLPWSRPLRETPWSSRLRTTSSLPPRAASWSAVPPGVKALTGNPASRSANTTALNTQIAIFIDFSWKCNWNKMRYTQLLRHFDLLPCAQF